MSAKHMKVFETVLLTSETSVGCIDERDDGHNDRGHGGIHSSEKAHNRAIRVEFGNHETKHECNEYER